MALMADFVCQSEDLRGFSVQFSLQIKEKKIEIIL